ncbi:MAG TPA: outer membrane protein assembly factor BamA [Thermoanaerobaculia bacterium]|jgi:outer membrane protein insertion porin family|nr:outer membrane protein assembly factor BamA [Thermoanaerobaculia bacterium]
MGAALLRGLVLRGAALALALALLGAGPAPAAAGPADPADPTDPAGPIVTAVEVRSDAPLDESLNFEDLIEVEPGQPLTDLAVRHTLRNLQATGNAAELELYTRDDPAGGGVVAVIVFRAVVQVEEVRIVGQLGLDRDDLRRVLPQGVAQPLSEERVVRGVFALQDLYADNGYFKSHVRVSVATNPLRRRAVITYQVDSGPRAIVRTIAFDHPVAPFAPAALVKQLRLKPGDGFSRREAREAADRLQSWLIGQRYGAARVDPPAEERDLAANSVKLTYPIEIGPRISLQVIGADEKTLRRKGLLPFLGEAGYDEALVQQAVGRLKSYHQQQGHYDVKVTTEEKRTDGELQLVFRIEPGPVYTLKEIVFEGNEQLSTKDLLQLLKTAPRNRLRPGSGRLVDADLNEDLDNLRRYYSLNGFANAKVGPASVVKKGTDLKLVIPVKEGPLQRVASLRFEGLEHLDEKPLRKSLPLREPGPFHPALLDSALDTLREEYAAKGYPQAQVSARQDWNPDHTLVDVTIQIVEGSQRLADRIIVRGNRQTKDDVIRRTLDLKHGNPISDTKLRLIERNLYRLGIFSRAEVGLVPSGLNDSERDVLVRVEEGKSRSVTYGLGWDSESGLRGLFGYSDNNVFGEAYSLRTDVRWSQRDKRFRLLFNQPYLFDHPISLTSTVFYEDAAEINLPFEVKRYGARSEAVRVYGARRFSLGLDYRIVKLRVNPGVAANDIERNDQPYQITSLVPSFFWDRRDDPISTTKGWSTLVQVQYAFPAFRTDTAFVKLFMQQTQFISLGRPGVVAASLRLGGIQPYLSLPANASDPLRDFPSRNVPIAERFFAGGDSSNRAYGRDELGIPGESQIPKTSGRGFLPVGGDGLLLFNLEYRFPVVGDFGGTLFYDAGNVWADWRSIRLRDVKSGVGIGARYLSPVGPIRAGIGWKLNREKGESGYQLFFNIGNPF